MRPESIFSNLRISTKLFLLNLMIVAAFILVAGIIIFSFAIIRNKVTEVANKDMRIVTENSQIARILSKAFSDIELLSHAFYGKNGYLQSEGTRLAGIVKDIEESSTDPDLKKSLLSLSKQFDAFLSQCAVVNTVLRDRESIDRETHIELTRLEDLIAELFVKSTLEGEDTSFVEQLLTLVVGYRESLLQIGKVFAELGQEHYSLPLDGKTSPLITLFDDLILRLQTITASIPEVRRHGEKIVNNVEKYKQAVFSFYKVMQAFGLRMTNLNQSKISTMSAMATIDNKISDTTLQVADSIEKIIIYSGAAVILLSFMVIISLGVVTTYLIRSNIKNPMKKILKGVESFSKKSFETQIELNRSDEWGAIEKSLNKMANELLKSYTALRESEEKYRNILEGMEEGYYEVDLAGNLIFFNNSMCKFIGYSKEELMGMNNREYTTPETAKRVYQIFNRVYRTGESEKIADFEFIRKDGTTIALGASAALIRDRGNRSVGFRGVCRDISERRRLEELRRRLETQIQQSQKLESIGILAAGVAHDFNNLLTRILGYIDIVKDDIEPESGVYDILLSAETECMGARVLTERFQDFSGDLTLILNSGSIVEIIKDSATAALSGTNVKSEFSIHDDLSWVRFDDRLVRRAINNLVLNAVESMPEGGLIKISIEDFTVDENDTEPRLPVNQGKYVRVSIQDEGIGISDEDLPKIFDPYFSTKGRDFQQGMGFGLTIAYSIIKKHNGYIYVSSQVGIGTTAFIYLPAVEEKIQRSELI